MSYLIWGFLMLFLLAFVTLATIIKILRMNFKKIGYFVATGVLTAIMIFSIQMYLRNPDVVAGYFENLNYPSYLVYPLAIAKILGLIAIWGNFSKWLKEWAYAGFFFDVTLALTAHLVAKDSQELFAIIAFVALFISYFLGKTERP